MDEKENVAIGCKGQACILCCRQSVDTKQHRKEERMSEENQNEIVNETEATEEKTAENKPDKQKKWKGILKELAIYVIMFVAIVYLVPNYVCARTVVDGPSMKNTLKNDDSVLLDKLTYHVADPKRFDVIVFYHFNDRNNPDKKDPDAYDLYVKRVIGLPGEKVSLEPNEDGTYSIYINDELLEENYGKDPIEDPGRVIESIQLGEDEYFVMGDNRDVSVDSRYEEVGNIKRDWILGKVRFRIFPLKQMKVVK